MNDYQFDWVICNCCNKPICGKIDNIQEFLNNPFWCHCTKEIKPSNVIVMKFNVPSTSDLLMGAGPKIQSDYSNM